MGTTGCSVGRARSSDTRSGPTTIGSPPNHDRVANRDELVSLLAAAFATRPAAHWLSELEAASVPCSPIRTMDEVFASPEGATLVDDVDDPVHGGPLRLVANPLRFDGERLPVRLPPPRLGADTDEVLDEG